MKKYLYLHGAKQHPIFVHADSRPSAKSVPKRGTWIVKEFNGKEWQMPAFPEIMWGTLKHQKYVGEIK